MKYMKVNLTIPMEYVPSCSGSLHGYKNIWIAHYDMLRLRKAMQFSVFLINDAKRLVFVGDTQIFSILIKSLKYCVNMHSRNRLHGY